MNYHNSLRQLVNLCTEHGDPFLDEDHEESFAKGVADSVKAGGATAYRSFIELLDHLFACRNQWVGLSLSIARQLPPSSELTQVLQRIAAASALASRPPSAAFRGEIEGGGNVGWAGNRCNFMRDKATTILADSGGSPTTATPPTQEADVLQRDDIKFDCPECAGSLAIEKHGAGLVVTCPHCSKKIHVPMVAESPAVRAYELEPKEPTSESELRSSDTERPLQETPRRGLADAIRDGCDLETVQQLLAKGESANSRERDGSPTEATALMRAAEKGQSEIVKLLLEKGADANATWNVGGTALQMIASRENNAEMIKLLIENGADVNARDRYGQTALYSAAIGSFGEGNLENVRVLLESGADANAVKNDGTTILSAVKKQYGGGNPRIVELLLEWGRKGGR